MERISLDKIQLIIKFILQDDWNEIEDNIINDSFSGKFSGYNIISEQIEKLENDQRDILQFNAHKHRDKCSKMEVDNYSLENIERLIEHILLEIPRASQNSKTKAQLARNETMNRDFRDKTKKFTNEIKNHEIKMDKMQGEFISILSIFSAIIIAFFGGINLLGSALNNLDKCSKYRLIGIVLIVGLIMFNVIYMLLYTISRLIKKNIGSKQVENMCKECKKVLSLKCLIIRYPLIFFYNYIILMLLLITSILYTIDKYSLINFTIDKILKVPKSKGLGGILSILLIIGSFALVSIVSFYAMKWFNCNLNKCKEDCEDKDDKIGKENDYDIMIGAIGRVASTLVEEEKKVEEKNRKKRKK